MNYISINDVLYFRKAVNNHFLVIPIDDKEQANMLAKNFHKSNHVGMNKLDKLTKTMYFIMPREIIREVVSTCVSYHKLNRLKQLII